MIISHGWLLWFSWEYRGGINLWSRLFSSNFSSHDIWKTETWKCYFSSSGRIQMNRVKVVDKTTEIDLLTSILFLLFWSEAPFVCVIWFMQFTRDDRSLTRSFNNCLDRARVGNATWPVARNLIYRTSVDGWELCQAKSESDQTEKKNNEENSKGRRVTRQTRRRTKDANDRRECRLNLKTHIND